LLPPLKKPKANPGHNSAPVYGDTGRDLALYLARKHCALKLAELGTLAGGLDYVTVAMAVRRTAARLERDKRLAAQAKQAIRKLCNL
jgi:hypothetical protein